MKIILDSHAFLWATSAPERLSPKLKTFLESGERPLLSAASLWEICIKVRIGKLVIAKPAMWLSQAVKDLQATVLPVRGNHAIATLSLPDHHRDPFDRIIVAQAIEEGAAIATMDARIKNYAVDIFW